MSRKTKFTWSDAIIEILKRHNNVATLKTLHNEAPETYSNYNKIVGRTPCKTINERVQRDDRITKLAPGLYTLTEFLNDLPKEYNPKLQTKEDKEKLTHISIQAILLQLGQLYKFNTYTPDKSKNILINSWEIFQPLQNIQNIPMKELLIGLK